MDIAKAKRRENIAEYILYLWQLEDLLRALQFSPEAIFSTLIAPRKDIAEEQKTHLPALVPSTWQTSSNRKARRRRDISNTRCI